ncbi:MAG: hypothetical protein Q7S02_04005 [bacterium]|nr:hypothetical protein [bacterium]
MTKRITTVIVGTALVSFTLLGAGCRKTAPPPAPPAAPQVEAPQATPTAPDPLADDLDAAIDDLNAIE